jgi:alkanesulfonate monooxygenase SsuD/methylene tetrahydromethanopterin reductase-like flavin-dependent oxidoreductase (luciferase family)
MVDSDPMKYGFVLPYGDARTAAGFAEAAEQAGWDGFFVWEPIYGWDAWVMLTAAAMRTRRIHLGTMLTPLSRMRPWKLASEALTLDHLSGGRVTLSVGLGAIDTGFEEFGEATGRKTRAQLLDEGLDIVTSLWRGEPFTHTGTHYHVDGQNLHYPPPLPAQGTHIPIWAVGAWPFEASMCRALALDGIIPSAKGDDGRFRQVTPDELTAMRAWLADRRDLSAFDIVVEGTTSTTDRDRAIAKVRRWSDAGATWYLEARWGVQEGAVTVESVRQRMEAGPPRID